MSRNRKVLEMSTGDMTKKLRTEKAAQSSMIVQDPSDLDRLPQDLINTKAKKEWKRVVPELKKMDIVGRLDITNLVAYCNAYSKYCEATKALRGQPLTVPSPSGEKENVAAGGGTVKGVPYTEKTEQDSAASAEKTEDEYRPGPEKCTGTGTGKTGKDQVREELAALESGSFFLFISTIEPRKNIVTIVHAFEAFKRREQEKNSRQEGSGEEENRPGQNIKLVLAGNKGWKYDEILAAVESSPYRNDILMPGYVSDTEKAMLLENAAAFLYPSLYEGFGIPILEAMYCGCPVVTSAVSSMPEVGGDAAFYIREPKNSEELADRMEEVCRLDSGELDELQVRMRRQVKKFSWKKNAEQMLQILCRRDKEPYQAPRRMLQIQFRKDGEAKR